MPCVDNKGFDFVFVGDMHISFLSKKKKNEIRNVVVNNKCTTTTDIPTKNYLSMQFNGTEAVQTKIRRHRMHCPIWIFTVSEVVIAGY